jgi:hypothetical protein
MGKLSPEQARQLKELQDLEAAEDDGEEESAWVQLENGQSVRLTGDRLRRYMRKHGFDEDDLDAATKDDPMGGKDAPTGPAKKTAAPAKKTAGRTATTEAGDNNPGTPPEDLEQDAPTRPRARQFF